MLTLFPEPRTASQAAYQIRIIERAKILWQDGYDWYLSDTYPFLFGICGPDGQHYGVNMQANTCNCEGFEKDRDCKHRIAVCNSPECYEATLERLALAEKEIHEALISLSSDRADRLVREAGYIGGTI